MRCKPLFLAIVATQVMLSASSGFAQVLPQAEAFSAAVERADVELVRAMLHQQPALATSRTSDGWPAFLQQAINFSPAILELFVRHGADPNVRNAAGETLLHLTADPVAIRLLLARGADIEARDGKGWTPLMGHAPHEATGPDAIYVLLAEGADPDARGIRGETAQSLLPQGAGSAPLKAAMRRESQKRRQ